MRARLKRRERRKKLTYITVFAVALALVIIAAYALSTLYQQNPNIGKPVTSKVYQELYGLATANSYGATDTSLVTPTHVKTGTGASYLEGSKPIVVYIGAEYCPYCAFQRWPLTIALMRFGNFSGLSYMQSSSTDILASTDTLTYYGSTYTSNYIAFQPIEAQTRTQGQSLQTVPSNYSSVFASYGSGFPFINIANKYIIPGVMYSNVGSYSDYLGSGLSGNWTKDVQNIAGGASELSSQVMSTANAITALICKVTGQVPAGVCDNPAVTAYSSGISTLSYDSSPSASLMAGIPSSSAQTWASVQYGQMAWRTKSSA
jgi:Domain of unknown function (DUF929)